MTKYQRFLLTGIQPSFCEARQRSAPIAPVMADQVSQRPIRDFQSLKTKSVVPAWAPRNTWKVHSIDPVSRNIDIRAEQIDFVFTHFEL